VTELSQERSTPSSTLFQRLQAEKALKQLERDQARVRFAHNVRMLWRERTFLFRLSVLGLSLGVIFALLIPVRYTSTARLMPPSYQPASPLAISAAGVAAHSGLGGIAGDFLGIRSSSELFVGILHSRTVQDPIIEQLDLKHVYGVDRITDARDALANCVSLTVDRKTEILTIAVTDQSPQRAHDIAAAYVDQLNLLVSELSSSSARRERIFLEGRLKQVNQDLEEAEREFSQFSSKNSTVDVKEQERTMVGAAATIQGQLISAQSELEGLRQIYSDSNVRVRSLKARIAELQTQLAKLGGKDQADRLGPNSAATDLYPSIRKLPLLGMTYADLYRRVKVQEEVYEVLTREYELAKVQEVQEIPTVKVLELPDVPERKASPPRRIIGLSTMFAAFGGGVIFLLVSNNWHSRDPRDLGKGVITEIWIDLKKKRFLNSANGACHEPGAHSNGSLMRRRGISSLLGLSHAAHSANGSHSFTEPSSDEECTEATDTPNNPSRPQQRQAC
jgi:capsule polysaccharide export protein KpsE/RkpR